MNFDNRAEVCKYLKQNLTEDKINHLLKMESYKFKKSRVITTIGIYNNGDFQLNGIAAEHLLSHVAYNLIYRPGRALVVEGVMIYRGYLSKNCKLPDPMLVANEYSQTYR